MINEMPMLKQIEYFTKVEVSVAVFIISSGVNQFKHSTVNALRYQPANIIETRLINLGNCSTIKGIANATVNNKAYNTV
jgi:hypothetical protein